MVSRAAITAIIVVNRAKQKERIQRDIEGIDCRDCSFLVLTLINFRTHEALAFRFVIERLK